MDIPSPIQSASTGHRRSRRGVVLAVAVIALVAVAIAWHLTALSAYRATSGGGPVTSRLGSARLAALLEPWDARYRWRVVALTGLRLLREGEADPAFWLLEPYSQIVRDDPVYRSVYQQVVATKTPLDARKAHVQHAREETGGVLLEKDVVH